MRAWYVCFNTTNTYNVHAAHPTLLEKELTVNKRATGIPLISIQWQWGIRIFQICSQFHKWIRIDGPRDCQIMDGHECENGKTVFFIREYSKLKPIWYFLRWATIRAFQTNKGKKYSKITPICYLIESYLIAWIRSTVFDYGANPIEIPTVGAAWWWYLLN